MYDVLLGVPSSGVIHESASEISWLSSLHHNVERIPSCQSGPNFNVCWQAGLNAARRGQITHLAMMHTDFAIKNEHLFYAEPVQGKRVLDRVKSKRWLDLLIEEMDRVGADFISTPMAIKDPIGGLTSCGVGNPDNLWNPWRRFTTDELDQMPLTFDAEMLGYGDKYLIHNHALCVWDMRKPLWQIPDEHGRCRFVFNFSEDLRLENGEWVRYQDSEDWAFSRQLWEAGAKTYISRIIKTLHHGSMSYANYGGEGLGDRGDQATRLQWQQADPIGTLKNGTFFGGQRTMSNAQELEAQVKVLEQQVQNAQRVLDQTTGALQFARGLLIQAQQKVEAPKPLQSPSLDAAALENLKILLARANGVPVS